MYKDREGKITDPLTVLPNILIFYCAELSGKFDGFGSQDFHLVPPVLVFGSQQSGGPLQCIFGMIVQPLYSLQPKVSCHLNLICLV